MGFDNAELQDEHLVSDGTSFVESFRGLLLLTRGTFLLSIFGISLRLKREV